MNMLATIVPKSDQINADDLIGGPRTIAITEVKFSGGTEQPVSMYFDGSDKAFRPCKSMCRVLVALWGSDANQYVGRSLTLYRDPGVKWGGLAVGGIRISHMSDITEPKTMALTETKGKRAPFTVKPLVGGQASAQVDKAADGVRALIDRINGANDPAILDAITGHATTVKQMAWLAENRPELHQQVSDAVDLRRIAIAEPEQGRDDADMGEAHTDDPFANMGEDNNGTEEGAE